MFQFCLWRSGTVKGILGGMARRAALRSPESLFVEPAGPDFRQERSRRSYQALLDAAEELFSKHGYDAVGTPEIAEQACVSVCTFYRYF